MDDYLTTTEVAERLGLSTARVRRMILDGIIEAEKVGHGKVVSEDEVRRIESLDRKPGRRRKAEDETLKENPASGLEREN